MELANLEEIGQAMPEILQVSLYPRWRLPRHLGSSTKVKTHPKHIYSDNAWNCYNLEEIGQAMPEILQVSINPRWRLRRLLGSSSKVKTHREHIYSENA
jgi:hypothetical protein